MLDPRTPGDRRDGSVARSRQSGGCIGEASRFKGFDPSGQLCKKGAVKTVAGPARIDGLHRKSGHLLTPLAGRNPSALRAELQRNQLNPQPQIEIRDGMGIPQSGQDLGIVEARKCDVRRAQSFMNDSPRTRFWPQLEAQIRIVGNLPSRLSDDLHRPKNAVACLAGDRLADPRDMKETRVAQYLLRQLLGAQAARRRTAAAI